MSDGKPQPRRKRQSIVPPQHGGWAFVGLPIVLGIWVAPWTSLLIVAAVGWIVAFPASYFTLAVLRYPLPRRFWRPLAIWAGAGIPLAIILLAARPWLVWLGAAYVLTFAINVGFARRRDERAMTNNTIFILECTAIVPAMWGIGAVPGGWSVAAFSTAPTGVWISSACCAMALVGSTLHVKSLIRERNDARFQVASQSWAAASLAVSVVLAATAGLPVGLLLTVPFAYLAIRSFAVAGRKLSPGRIGMIELVGFVLLAAVAPFAM